MQYAQYKKMFEQMLVSTTFDMIRLQSKLFLPIGLELNSMNIFLESNEEFSLTGMTFAYYNALDNSIRINIEDPVFKDCTSRKEQEAKLFFILYHESMHKILMHTPDRINNREPMLWNIACDYEIHNMLYVYLNSLNKDTNSAHSSDYGILQKYFDYIDKWVIKQEFPETISTPRLLFSENYLDNIAEEIYEKLHEEMNQQSEQGDGDGSDDSQVKNSKNGKRRMTKTKSSKVDICGEQIEVEETTFNLDGKGKAKSINIKWPPESQLPPELQKSEQQKEVERQNASTNKTLMETAMSQLAKERGHESSKITRFLKKLFHIKIDWEKILRNSLQTSLEQSDYFAWNKIRTSTFLLPSMSYLPDIVEAEDKYGTLIISRDESGSMTNEMVAKAGAIIREAKAHYKKIVFISHDTEITSVEEFEELNDDILQSLHYRKSMGGTSHKAVFEYIKEYQLKHRDDRISCYIGITDMDSDIEENQTIIPANVPIIYLTPVNYYRNYENVNGKVIQVEL